MCVEFPHAHVHVSSPEAHDDGPEGDDGDGTGTLGAGAGQEEPEVEEEEREEEEDEWAEDVDVIPVSSPMQSRPSHKDEPDVVVMSTPLGPPATAVSVTDMWQSQPFPIAPPGIQLSSASVSSLGGDVYEPPISLPAPMSLPLPDSLIDPTAPHTSFFGLSGLDLSLPAFNVTEPTPALNGDLTFLADVDEIARNLMMHSVTGLSGPIDVSTLSTDDLKSVQSSSYEFPAPLPPSVDEPPVEHSQFQLPPFPPMQPDRQVYGADTQMFHRPVEAGFEPVQTRRAGYYGTPPRQPQLYGYPSPYDNRMQQQSMHFPRPYPDFPGPFGGYGDAFAGDRSFIPPLPPSAPRYERPRYEGYEYGPPSDALNGRFSSYSDPAPSLTPQYTDPAILHATFAPAPPLPSTFTTLNGLQGNNSGTFDLASLSAMLGLTSVSPTAGGSQPSLGSSALHDTEEDVTSPHHKTMPDVHTAPAPAHPPEVTIVMPKASMEAHVPASAVQAPTRRPLSSFYQTQRRNNAAQAAAAVTSPPPVVLATRDAHTAAGARRGGAHKPQVAVSDPPVIVLPTEAPQQSRPTATRGKPYYKPRK